MKTHTNVASNSCISGPVHLLWELFERADYSDDQLPDDRGRLPSSVTSGFVYGSVGIRDRVGEIAMAAADRDEPYSKQHARNLMKEGRVLSRCVDLVPGIPKISESELEQTIWKLVRSKDRRKRNRTATSC
jgi:hypothetical protein